MFEGTFHKLSGHGTIRDELNEKRRLHAFRITYKLVDGFRVPIVEFREHDYFDTYRGDWNTHEPLEIFKDVKTLMDIIHARTLVQTPHVRINFDTIMTKVNDIEAHLNNSKAQVAYTGHGGAGVYDFHRARMFWDAEKAKSDTVWDAHKDDESVTILPNTVAFTGVPLPTKVPNPKKIPPIGDMILKVRQCGFRRL